MSVLSSGARQQEQPIIASRYSFGESSFTRCIDSFQYKHVNKLTEGQIDQDSTRDTIAIKPGYTIESNTQLILVTTYLSIVNPEISTSQLLPNLETLLTISSAKTA
jgi:hypothetical protein